MPGKGEPQSSPRRLSAAARRQRAVDLRVAGLTFEAIAQTPTSRDDPRPLYPGPSGRQRAHEAVMAAMAAVVKDTRGQTAELRAMELARLDTLQMSLTPGTRPARSVACEECGHTMWREVDHDAVRNILQVMGRRAKYLGLDAVRGEQQDPTAAASMITSLVDALTGNTTPDNDTDTDTGVDGSPDAED